MDSDTRTGGQLPPRPLSNDESSTKLGTSASKEVQPSFDGLTASALSQKEHLPKSSPQEADPSHSSSPCGTSRKVFGIGWRKLGTVLFVDERDASDVPDPQEEARQSQQDALQEGHFSCAPLSTKLDELPVKTHFGHSAQHWRMYLEQPGSLRKVHRYWLRNHARDPSSDAPFLHALTAHAEESVSKVECLASENDKLRQELTDTKHALHSFVSTLDEGGSDSRGGSDGGAMSTWSEMAETLGLNSMSVMDPQVKEDLSLLSRTLHSIRSEVSPTVHAQNQSGHEIGSGQERC